MCSNVEFEYNFDLLTDDEKNLVMYAASKMKKNNSLCVPLLVDEMINKFDFDNQDVFDTIFKTVESLYDKSFIGENDLRSRWILGYTYPKDKKYINVEFAPIFNKYIMKKKWSVYKKESIE